MKYIQISAIIMLAWMSNSACNGNNGETTATNQTTKQETKAERIVPNFDEQSAYDFIATQVGFGPRVPNTPGQLKCADWLEQTLKAYTDTVYRQQVMVTAGDGLTELRCINLVGSIRPNATKRILLLAHWDTRPWADKDTKDQNKPIDGADDGGSGTAVLLEIAKTLKNTPLHDAELGIDILLVDAEDYGKASWGDASYALGTQYWAKHPHVPNYRAMHGILLDMVGGKNATFRHEGFSKEFAPNIVNDVWTAAYRAGYSSYFLNEPAGFITDDHVPINRIMKIPTIDIINLPTNTTTGFVQHWHTHDDNLSNIDKNTLKAVGQSLLYYLYNY